MRPALLVVFVDALGPAEGELLRASGLSLAHDASLRGVLGYSSGAIPTILTGASPAVHGRMCLFSRATGRSPLAPLRWLGLLPRVVHERGALRRAAGRAIARLARLDGYVALHRVPPALFPALDMPERDDLFDTGAIGGAPTFLGRARDAGMRVLTTSWRADEASRIDEIEGGKDADLVFLYLSGLDAILHADGRVGPRAQAWARRAVRWIDRARRSLARRASGREVQVLVVGDHGMASVDRVVDPRGIVERLRAIDPSAFVFVDSTMLRVGFHEREAEVRLRGPLLDLPGVLLDRAALASRGAPSAGEYGDLVALLPEGTIFAPSYVGGRVAGMHGYDLGDASSRAAILSNMPLPGVSRLEDVAPLVCRALGIETELAVAS